MIEWRLKRSGLLRHHVVKEVPMNTRIAVLLILTCAAAAASAQTLQVRQYAAKFVCGKATDVQVGTFDFAPGSYFTTINVHNPALTAAIEFRKKFALAERNEQPGKVSEWFGAALKPDQAMQIDCGSIYKHLGIPPGTFLDGFAVIQIANPKQELDVVAVYTASPGNGVATLHTERVLGRITQ
jgi:hypothetical protein